MDLRKISLLIAAATLAACKPGGGGAPKSAGVCSTGVVDLSKINGDWISSTSVKQPEGTYPGDQYRIRFEGAPAADGKLKASLAFLLDSRPYTGTFTPSSLGGQIDLIEDMSDETIAQLKKNADPNVPMRSVVRIKPEEQGCVLFVSDEIITYAGDKEFRRPNMGTLKMIPMPASNNTYSFVRCVAFRSVYFDDKADDNGLPVRINAGKQVMAKVTRVKKDLPDCPFSADVFVDGKRVSEKVAATVGKEEGVDAVIWQAPITLPPGPPHGVELHTYQDCPDGRKLIASACNKVITP